MVPDRTTIPGRIDEPTPAATSKVRPLSQYGSAEALAGVFTRHSMAEIEPGDFEQADATLEELRKAIPAQLTPVRPAVESPSQAKEVGAGS
jgi:hypothetical protein